VDALSLPGLLRRVRRIADLSQRELAVAVGISPSAVGSAESGARDLPLSVVARIAEVAALRLALVDGDGREIDGMAENSVRDTAGRRLPAHLDPRYSDDRWWHGPDRKYRTQPRYTFDRRRDVRDWNRERVGIPDDHQLPQPGDSPEQRAEERRRARSAARTQERERRFLAGEFAGVREAFSCTCPTGCDDLDDRSGTPVHADACRCHCDIA
jgi:transcriptional regulator with XRE-family HTH domain